MIKISGRIKSVPVVMVVIVGRFSGLSECGGVFVVWLFIESENVIDK